MTEPASDAIQRVTARRVPGRDGLVIELALIVESEDEQHALGHILDSARNEDRLTEPMSRTHRQQLLDLSDRLKRRARERPPSAAGDQGF